MSHRIDVSNILRQLFYKSISTHSIAGETVHALAIVTLLCSLTSVSTFTGRVIEVADGDTISVLPNGEAVGIRVDGVDCPESEAEFSAKAKKFTFSLSMTRALKCRVRKGRGTGDWLQGFS